MKSVTTALTVGLAVALAVPMAFADDDTTTTTTTTTTAEETGTTTPPATSPPPAEPGSGPYVVAVPITESTETRTDTVVVKEDRDDRVKVHSGIGLNVMGAAGSSDATKLGVGGRLEVVLPFALTLGASYTQYFANNPGSPVDHQSAFRPLLGEVGVALPVARVIEVRPMLGIGYAFVTTSGDTANTGTGQNSTASGGGSIHTAGFDVAPGAKVSYVNHGLELFTLPKYHIIKDENFFGLEVGAGARF
jgi:hypothetical protein